MSLVQVARTVTRLGRSGLVFDVGMFFDAMAMAVPASRRISQGFLSALPVALLACCSVLAECHAATLDEGRVIVKLKGAHSNLSQPPDTPAATRIGRIGRRTGLALQQGRSLSAAVHVLQSAQLGSKALAKQLSSDPDVEYVVVDERRTIQTPTVPNDTLYAASSGAFPTVQAGQWYLRAPDSTTLSGIDAETAWSINTGSPTGVVVAVLDTGVRYEHPDLLSTGSGGKLLPGAAMLSGQSIRSNDATDTGDWVTANQCGSGTASQNSSWHGTQVSGLVGALSNNSTGMAGVGWGVRVLPVRVLAQCGGYDSDIIAAMNWAVGDAVSGVTQLPSNIASQVKVLNLSLGSTGACSAAYIDAINNVRSHGAVVVVAAGNSDGQAVGAPANCPGVIAVGGLRHAGTKVGYSAVGSEISLSAPGGNCVNTGGGAPCLYPLLTTTDAGLMTATASTYTDSQKSSLGTSFAAPLVSGTAALMLNVRPELLPDDVRRLLQDSTLPFPVAGGVAACHAPDGSVQTECNCTTTTCGAGMLNAGRAVTAAGGVVPRVTVSPASPHPGQTVTLDASGSLPSPLGTTNTYSWAVADSGGIISGFSGSATSPQITVTPTATGRFIMTLTVTDDNGASATTTEAVTVTAVVAAASSHGGGGAASVLSLLLLAAAVGALARSRRPQL